MLKGRKVGENRENESWPGPFFLSARLPRTLENLENQGKNIGDEPMNSCADQWTAVFEPSR